MENLANIQVIQNIVYIISSVMFILGIKMLGKEALDSKRESKASFSEHFPWRARLQIVHVTP